VERVREVEGTFPDCEKVIPTDAPVFTVKVNPGLLAELLNVIAKLQGKDSKGSVTLSFFGPERSIKISGNCQGDDVLALIMPMTA